MMTYEELLERVLDRVPLGLDKREGSIIYDALAPACAELAQLYIMLDYYVNATFADTAPREYLIRRAQERGIFMKSATAAIATGVFNIDIPLGSRFSSTNFNWVAIKKIDTGRFSIRCESPGNAANAESGVLIPIDYISGLETARIEKIDIYGEDDEDTETLRKRYFESFKKQAFGGNNQDYNNKVTSIAGVGGCKVFRTTNAKGQLTGAHVQVIITDSKYNVPSTVLVSNVQQTLDPKQDQEGDGLVPVGHICHVLGVQGKKIDIEFSIVYDTGFNYGLLKNKIEEAGQ